LFKKYALFYAAFVAWPIQQEPENRADGGGTRHTNCEDLMTYTRLLVFLVPFLVFAFVNPSAAQHLRGVVSHGECVLTNNGRRICDSAAQARATRMIDGNGNHVARVDEGTIIGGRPAGCPHRYCGCGLRKYLGIADKRLNLASNWARLFPRVAGPAPGVAAVRSGHVMYIERAAGNGQWLVRDYNSGGGLSRLHVRGVRGYVFVNPHVQRLLVANN
jgi:hypothetical protein